MRSWSPWILLTLLPALSHAGEAASFDWLAPPGYVARAWTRADGLPTDNVEGVVQTTDGYLWLGTEDGVVRFDGVRMRVFDAGNTPGLTLNLTPHVAEDASGRLVAWGAAPWVAIHENGRFRTYGIEVGLPKVGIQPTLYVGEEIVVPGQRGVHRLRDGRYEALHPDLAGRTVYDIIRGRDGRYLVAAEGLGLVRVNGDALEPVAPVDGVVYRVAEGGDGTLWLSTDRGVLRVRGDETRVEPLPAMADPPLFLAVQPDDGSVWVGGEEGLFRRSPWDAVWERVHDGPCRALHFPDEGGAWAACGPVVLHDGVEVFTAPDPVNALTTDREGNLWITTEGSGVIRLRRAVVATLSTDLPVECVTPDGADGFWLSSPSGILRHAGPDGVRERNHETWIRSLCPGSDGKLYGASWDGLFVLGDGPPESALPREFTRQVYSVYESHDGDLWASGFGTIGRRHEGAWERFTPEDGTSNGPMRFVAEGSDGALWFATPQGALRWDGAGFRMYTVEDGLSSNRIRSGYQDERGAVWLGTEGRGLDRMVLDETGDVAQVTSIRETDGLFENGVLWIGEDDRGRLWMTSNRGIFWIFREEADAFAAGEIERVHCRAFTEHQGMASPVAASAGVPTAFFSGDRLVAATEAGVVVVPLDPTGSVPPPEVRLESVTAGGRTLLPGEDLVLTPGERSFEVAYTAPVFTESEQIRFRYRLEGLQDEWVDAGARRTAYFTHIPQGKYRFQVEAAGADGGWSGSQVSLPLVVAARPWETGWFLALAVLAGVVLVAAGFVVRLRMARRRELDLERQVAERTQELARQTARLEELDRAKSRFFANVSHEFRTPLTLTIGPLEDLLSGFHGRLNEDAQRELRIALDSSRSVLDLVNQILDLAKLESGRFRLQGAEFDMASMLRAVGEEFAPLSERRKIPLRLELPGEPIPVLADETLLRRVFANLLSNAFKFTESGGTVTIALARAGDDDVSVEVRDSGVGIPDEDRERIFDRFHQASGTLRAEPGTGIGLSLARELVELHGGRIEVESTVGRGTTFRVTLPLAAEPSAEAVGAGSQAGPLVPTGDADPRGDAAVPESDEDRDRTTILVAEDHPQVRALLRKHLARDYRLLEAGDGRAALERARKEIPDLILSDVMMPEMDGMELCRRVKEDPEIGFVPVVLLTARADVEDRVQGFDLGADAYVAKPFEARVLLAQIEALIRERRRLRDRYTASAPALPVEGISNAGRAYVGSVASVIAENLADEEFSVEKLAEALGQTRSTLFRRLKEAGGVTPSELIRTMRLDRAKLLLEEKAGTVNEVAYGVGFKSVSHFCTAFKAAFGSSPGEWASRHARPRV